MANEFFNHDSPLAALSRARSSDINTLMAAVAAGFDKLPSENEMKFGSNLTGIESGSGNTFAVTIPHTPSSVVSGSRVWFVATHSNTGASVLNLNGLGAISITRLNGQPLQANDINLGQVVCAAYTGSVWNLVMTSVPDVAKKADDETITGDWKFTEPLELNASRVQLSELDGSNEVWFRSSADDSDLMLGLRRTGTNNYSVLVKVAGVTQTLMHAGNLALSSDDQHGVRGGGTQHAAATASVAGFMSAADKVKLNGIESDATADLTAAEILALLLTVDGAGSGLDADRLDGQDSAFYRDAGNLNAGTMPAARLPTATTLARGGVILADQAKMNALADATVAASPAVLGPLFAAKANTSGTYLGLSVGHAETAGSASSAAYAGSANYAGNADAVGGYTAAQLWRADQATFTGGANWNLKRPDNLIEKGGTGTSTTDVSQEFLFATAFPTGCLGVYVTITTGGTSRILPVTSWNSGGFIIDRDDAISDNTTFVYRAIGY